MKRISTHVLDLTKGKPAAHLPVRLERQENERWRVLNSAATNDDGRCGQLLSEDNLPPGFYRLVFDTATYFTAVKIAALYPVVEITFQVRDGESQVHIPLLLSPNGYTTYRGS
ncbi:MAG TPA: hydroxyisourate hydrolase [Candidatus Solibacter sp.]|nr:hydroxyisourate hydrolase [Candidatus Solibacter sp.]